MPSATWLYPTLVQMRTLIHQYGLSEVRVKTYSDHTERRQATAFSTGLPCEIQRMLGQNAHAFKPASPV
ncbi:MAG: hypothetical protein AAF198_07385 [Pseudomonadota bacterium]